MEETMRIYVVNNNVQYICGDCPEELCNTCRFRYRCLLSAALAVELLDFDYQNNPLSYPKIDRHYREIVDILKTEVGMRSWST